MIKQYCKFCKDKHFNNYACSNCGIKYSATFPIFGHGSALLKEFNKRIKFCPMCGHKFKKAKDEGAK